MDTTEINRVEILSREDHYYKNMSTVKKLSLELLRNA
jgi:hypothetical protein